MANKVGKPETYTKEIGENLCSMIAKGRSVKSICDMEGMPSLDTFYSWNRKHKEFADNYTQATVDRTEYQLEQLNEMGDISIEEAKNVNPKSSNAVVSAYKLKADNMKWVMARMKPKKYGDKIDHTTGGEKLQFQVVSFRDDNTSDK